MRALAIIIACSVLLGGCAEVKPWDRDLLAQKQMQLVPAPVDDALGACVSLEHGSYHE